MLWTDILSGDFEAAVEQSKGVCGLVVGCVEHHGKHLPLGQDVIHAGGVAEIAAEKEPIVLFPHMYFGEKQGAGEFAGTIIFSSKLIFDILTETCAEIARNGFKKIVLINGHGGNVAMLNNFARSILHDKNEYMVFVYNSSSAWPKVSEMIEMIDGGKRDYFPELTDDDIQVLRNHVANCKVSGHGCFRETGITLGLRPDLVDLSRLNDVDGCSTHRLDHISKAGFYTPFGWMSSYPNSLSSDGHDGNNERIGRSLVKYASDKMAEAFKILKDDAECEKYMYEWLAKQK